MKPGEPPTPALATDTELSYLQAQLAAENLCAAVSDLLTLIRTLRLSLLLMDEETIKEEEDEVVYHSQQSTRRALLEAAELEEQLLSLRAQNSTQACHADDTSKN